MLSCVDGLGTAENGVGVELKDIPERANVNKGLVDCLWACFLVGAAPWFDLFNVRQHWSTGLDAWELKLTAVRSGLS